MKVSVKGAIIIFLALFILLATLPANSIPFNKKLQVIAEQTKVYVSPNENSTIVETLDRGVQLTLAAPGKVKKSWYYVYFLSPQTGRTKAGYVIESHVKKLYSDLIVIDITSDIRGKEEGLENLEFGNPPWGMSREDIKAIEGPPLGLDEGNGYNVLKYRRKILGRNCLVDYIFVENHLVKACYSFADRRADKNEFIRDYEELKKFLSQEFGSPAENILWVSEEYKNVPHHWGQALSLGLVSFVSEWSTPDKEISLSLYQENGRIVLQTEQNTRGYKALARR